MKINKLRLIVLAFILIFACQPNPKSEFISGKVDFAAKQINNAIAVYNSPGKVPRTIEENGDLRATSIFSWTSGFFAGNLWEMYDLTGDKTWMDKAIEYTEALDTIQYITEHHDVGFMINCSYGSGLYIGEKQEYKDVLIQAATSLSTRFNPTIGCIKS